jgi:2-phospho-L-lactate transferase/gluconeogenesis factor (CofD/UPF0052 family)
MSHKLTTAADISAAFAARYPISNTLSALSAASDQGRLDTVQAASFRPFATVSGALKIVKATNHFFVAGSLIQGGELVEVEESVANRLEANGQAVPATDEEIAEAQKPAKAK